MMAVDHAPVPSTAATPRREPPDAAQLPLPPASSVTVHTPGSQAQQRRPAALPPQHRGPIPPSSGRRNNGAGVLIPMAPPATATPHGRAARRAIDSRRAAILTPHRRNRRRSQREARETPRRILQGLARVLASKSQPIHTSSSSSPGASNGAGGSSRRRRSGRLAGRNDESSEDELADPSFLSRRGGDGGEEDDDDDDDDDDDLPKRPRLSLPLADDECVDSDSDLVPHQSAGLEDQDDDFTRQSVEFARRYAFPDTRLSLGGRPSDFQINFNPDEDDQNDTNINVMAHADPEIDSGFFPPQLGEDLAYRLDSDPNEPTTAIFSSPERPAVVGEGTMIIDMSPQRLDSPTHQVQDFDEPAIFPDHVGDNDDDDENMGYVPLDDGGFSDDHEEDDAFGVADVATATVAAAADAAATTTTSRIAQGKRVMSRSKPSIRKSKHGLEYSTAPPRLVKRAALQFASSSGAKGRIAPDVLQALSTASDWFFEQLGEDLGAYARHANRKTIDESDVRMLMKRQRLLNSSTSVFSLAQKYLPRELLQGMRMVPPPAPAKTRRKKNNAAASNGEVT